MPHTVITPDAAYTLQQQGALYVDVRTPEEFAAGHPAGATNIPAFFREEGIMLPNEDFVEQIRAISDAGAPLLLGCRSGARSGTACEWLAGAGYTTLYNIDGGFAGRQSPSGEIAQPGWQALGLPVE